MPIYNFTAPALPLPGADYDQGYQDQLLSALRLYFNRLDQYNLAASTPASGATADRPLVGRSIGQFYFDTTLGIPIWWNDPDWVDASGTAV